MQALKLNMEEVAIKKKTKKCKHNVTERRHG